jgi:radical SAM protein with 4Fe4S-binding SPASM domain
MIDQNQFLQHRTQQENIIHSKNDPHNPLSSLVNVQFNITELCNRACIFCPRVDPIIYPNRNLHISVGIIDKITKDLSSINFKGRISLSGFGEPLLNRDIINIITTIKKNLPKCILDTNTNGDRLSKELIDKIYTAGLDKLYVNMYDGPAQTEYYTILFNNINEDRYIFRPHWEQEGNNYNLILNNRGGTINSKITGFLSQPLKKQCYFPFSTAMIDYNGDLILCPQDWGRKYVVESLIDNHIKDVWLGDKLKHIRLKLANYDRSENPCNTCNTAGTLTGKLSYEILMKYYEDTNKF